MKKRKRLMIIYGCLIFIVAVISALYLVSSLTGNDGDAFLLNENSNEYQAFKYGDGFLTFDGKLVSYYGTDMSQRWVLAIDENDANIAVSGNKILIYSSDSGKISLYEGDKLITQYESDKKIRAVSVNESGYATVLSSDKGYKGQCTVYDDEGNHKARYSYGKKYILAAFLAEDNKSLFMSIVDETDNMFVGKAVFMDIKSGKIKSEIETEEIAPFMITEDNKLILSDDNALSVYNKNGDKLWDYNYEGKRAEYIKYSDKIISIVLKDGAAIGNTSVISLSLSGRIKGSFESENPIDACDVSEGYTAVKVGNEIKLINKRGKVTGSAACEANTYEILLYEDKNKVLTLSGSAEMKKFGR